MAKKIPHLSIPSIGNLPIEIKLYGDWHKAIELVDNLGPSIKKGYDIAVNKFSKDLLKIVLFSIATGTPPKGTGINWEPHSPITTKKYGEHPIYYLTGTYYRAIGLFKYKDRTLVGLPRSKGRSSSGGITLGELAKILEYGTGGKGGGKSNGTIPPRPLWNPSIKAVGGKEKLRSMIIKNIRKQLYGFGIRANQVKWR